jgi:hypothetical protein
VRARAAWIWRSWCQERVRELRPGSSRLLSQNKYCLKCFFTPVPGFGSGLRIRIHFIRIRIQHFRLNTDPDPIRIQGFYDQKWEKNTAEKKIKFFWIKNYNLPIPRPP